MRGDDPVAPAARAGDCYCLDFVFRHVSFDIYYLKRHTYIQHGGREPIAGVADIAFYRVSDPGCDTDGNQNCRK